MRNNRGITLIALVITIIVILILVAVTVRATINGGLFGHAKIAVKRWRDAEEQEENEINNIVEILDGEDNEDGNYVLNIDIKVPIYNASVGEFPAVFRVKGTKGGKVIYENIVGAKISSPTPEPIKVKLSVPDGTKVEVTSIFNDGNYTMSELSKETVLSTDEEVTVSFFNNYNNKIHKTSTAIISFSGQEKYRN